MPDTNVPTTEPELKPRERWEMHDVQLSTAEGRLRSVILRGEISINDAKDVELAIALVEKARYAFPVDARLLNASIELFASLKTLLQANDDVQTALADGPEVPGFDRSVLSKAQARVTEAERAARAIIEKVEFPIAMAERS